MTEKDDVPSAAMRALMSGAIDYAGLFPPAALPMAEAVGRYASYRAGPHAWMLGRFITPVGRLEEFVAAFTPLPAHDGGPPWPISVIGTASDAATLAAFNARYGSRTRIDTIEVPPVRQADMDALAPLAATYTVFAEVGWRDDPAPLVAQLAAHGLRAKIRTGGVTPDAFPTGEVVARFILACHAAKVPFKATAGLHHAWRGDYPLTYEAAGACGTMHGFANVLIAGVAAAAGAAADELGQILGAVHGTGIGIDRRGCVLPSGRQIVPEAVAAARRSTVTSFGSCSFDEPVAELTQRGLL